VAELVWYYARGGVERGPFTLTQIRALANASKLRPDDLVWKEGMDNWTAAREVNELFPAAGLVGDQAGSNGAEAAGDARSVPTAARSSLALPGETQDAFQRVARALAFLGAVLVVGTRGCESLGERRATRLSAVAELSALENAATAEEDKRTATTAALEHQANAFARGVALQMGLLVLLAGAIGLTLLSDRYECALGIGLVLVVIFSVLGNL
jgi:hypothetical protein